MHPQQPLPAALAASRCLVQLQPGSTAALYRLALQLQRADAPPAEVAAADAAVLRAAERERSYSIVAAAALSSATSLGAGGPGHSFSLAEVRRLIATGERATALCRPWMLQPHVQQLADGAARLKAGLRLAVSRARPGQDQLPSHRFGEAPGSGGGGGGGRPGVTPGAVSALPTCAGCGRKAARTKRCSACHSVHYCSTDCQRSHWRMHKAKCWRLAAQQAGEAAAAQR